MANDEYWSIGGAIPGLQVVGSCKHIMDELGITNIHLSVFDNHFGLAWCGGRLDSVMTGHTKETFVDIVRQYNSMGIPFNLVFSNLFLEKQHLSDKRCNWVLEQCYRKGNRVIVTSHLLAEYIRERFPDYKLIHSLTHFYLDPKYYL